MDGIITVVALGAVALAACCVGFLAAYLWMRAREARLSAAHAEALSASAEQIAALKVEQERALAARDAALAEREAALDALEARAAGLAAEVARLEAELDATRVTVGLERFSDFQLLGMCDVFDAEQAEGALRRPYGDPAMEQLMNLGIVDFEMPHDGGRDKTPRWTLAPEWRAAVRSCRAQMDERTEELRARRDAKQAL